MGNHEVAYLEEGPMSVIPMVVEQTVHGERSVDIYSRLLNERIIVVGSAIDERLANLVVAQLIHLEAADPDRDVALYINSPGGDVYGGLAIYDTMQFIRPDVQTICFGIAMSMGAVLLAAGSPGKRLALPNSKVMIHQAWTGGYQGQASDIEIRARELLSLQRRLEEILAHHTGKPVEQVHEDVDRDNFLSADEAKAYGLIDRIMDRRELNGH